MKLMIVKDRNVLNTKFLAQFVNSLARLGHDVHVVCDSYNKQGSGVTLDNNVKFTNLNGKTHSKFTNIYRFLRQNLSCPYFRFKKFIEQEKPDVIICYFPIDLFNVAFLQQHKIPIIMMMHCYPPAMLGRFKKKSALKRWIYQQCFSRVDVFQVLMKSYETTIAPFYPVKKVVTIPNEVVQIPAELRTDLNNEKKRIIYVARVEKAGKRQHLIVEAFAKIASEFPDWQIEFWGLEKYQDYNNELMELAKKHHIENNVHIKGYHPNIQEVYRQADIHAFPSLHEGFSLALADGMAMGLPSIGFMETPSVNELIIDGHNGFLAKDTEDFAAKLKLLMADKELRIRLGQHAAQDMEAYKPETVIAMWDELIRKTVLSDK